ncbi:TetR/AcrR family transcriptional regulator [Subtercola lobariae]|nr:TetR/AcrR family transcriptional regulator [Subtercola lobariae]
MTLEQPTSGDLARGLRADAQSNRDRVLEAAARLFQTEGADTSLKAIAKEAGVGIGTLYRRFPTREALIEATYRTESAKLAAAASTLVTTLPPVAALRTWMELFTDYMATKHGMADALRAVLTSGGDLRMQTRDLMQQAVAELMAAGVATDELRSDLDPDDVLLAMGGVSMITGTAEQRTQAARMLDLLLDGVKQPSTPASR